LISRRGSIRRKDCCGIGHVVLSGEDTSAVRSNGRKEGVEGGMEGFDGCRQRDLLPARKALRETIRDADAIT
jgi:hypothetical protein